MYRQKGFWLRDHSKSRDYNLDSWSSFKVTNRSIWCEACNHDDDDDEILDVARVRRGLRTIPVSILRQQSRLNWYPNDSPLGVMKFLRIKEVL